MCANLFLREKDCPVIKCYRRFNERVDGHTWQRSSRLKDSEPVPPAPAAPNRKTHKEIMPHSRIQLLCLTLTYHTVCSFNISGMLNWMVAEVELLIYIVKFLIRGDET